MAPTSLSPSRSSSLNNDEGPDTEAIKAKYLEVTKKRNFFIKGAVAGIIVTAVGLSIPKIMVNRAHNYIWRRYLRGNVLTLTPKLLENATVDQFEATSTVKVSCIVKQIIKSDHHYAEVMDACKTEAEKQQVTRDMTLSFVKANDPHWVHSSISFGTVLESDIEGMFDAVVIDNELWHTSREKSKEMLMIASRALKPDGHLILTDVAAPRLIKSWVVRLHDKTDSDINLAHNYEQLLVDSQLEVRETRKAFLGFFQCIAAQKPQSGSDKEK